MQTLCYSHPVYYILSIPVYSSLCNVLFINVHCTCTHVLKYKSLELWNREEIAPCVGPEVRKFGLGDFKTSAIGCAENHPGTRNERRLQKDEID